jgi:hypothetical protein
MSDKKDTSLQPPSYVERQMQLKDALIAHVAKTEK